MPRRSARLAGSMAVGTSSAANPESPVNAANHEHSSGTDSERNDEEPVRPRKRLKQLTPNIPNLHPSLQLKNVRGRRGALKDIVEMPIDILHEIIMYLTPVEVVTLSQMCKALRRILMTKSAEFVWKQARLNLDGFPDCPDDLNEAQFANLIFAPLCGYCKKAKGRYFIWSIRWCYCNACLTHNKGLIRLFKFTDGTNYPDILPVLPSIDPRTKTESLRVHDNHLILKASANQLLRKFQKFRKSDNMAREVWIQELKDTRESRITHGYLCEKWLRMQGDKRAAQFVEIRKRRYEAIKQRLTDLGWGKELETIRGMSSWPSVNQSKDLTDRMWQNIKDDIIQKMEEHRAEQYQKNFLLARRKRRRFLKSCLSNLQHNNRGKVILPNVFDLASTEPILALINAPDLEETIEYPESLIFELAQNWRTSCDTVLRNMVVTSTTPTSKLDPLSLATTFFSCWRDSICNVFQYPEVLKHKCATTFDGNNQCPWNGDGKRIMFAAKAYSSAKAILEELGFNPDTTTREDVQWPAFILECHECSMLKLDGRRRALMSWPVAVQHAIGHGDVGERPRMLRANLSDTELQHVQSVAPSFFGDRVLCARCQEQPRFIDSWSIIREHIERKHKVRQPIESTDYIWESGFHLQPITVLTLTL